MPEWHKGNVGAVCYGEKRNEPDQNVGKEKESSGIQKYQAPRFLPEEMILHLFPSST
ncbi:hypothetical protein HYV91_01600 [Candidatus Wolfebacteria bacterium]|nr:hypothetical protein [Candidatus Wolfebacteria bacterium]